MKYINKVSRKDNIFGDNIAFTELWDFSRANISEESRIEAITKVASVCYDNPNVIGKESLYNRLKAESLGLPSSSFEFVPVLLDKEKLAPILLEVSLSDKYGEKFQFHIGKYGEFVEDAKYILTNYRAVLRDSDIIKKTSGVDITQWFNTEEDCEIIKQHHKVFLNKIDLVTRSQYIRHRVSWQELSRRYVSGKKTPFEFYVSKNNSRDDILAFQNAQHEGADFKELCSLAEGWYYEALESGIQPQEARRIMPQCTYTTLWSAWYPSQLENYLELRIDSHSQQEIRRLAQAQKEMVNGK